MAATLNTFSPAFMAIINGNCVPELLRFDDRVELGDCALLIGTNSY
ncbi:MAG: hypothetical protein ACRBM6_12855 [Geminicoccales bacterium]